MMKGEEDRPITAMGADEARFQIDQRQDLQRREIEDYLLRSAFAYGERRDELWARDYTSVQTYAKSIEPNRRRLAEALGVFDAEGCDFAAEWRPFFEDDKVTARRLQVQAAPGLFARAVLALPAKGAPPFPLVVCQHGIASSPERVFGFDDPSNIYKGYGRALAERGFAVLAPSNTTGHRSRSK